MGCGCQGGTGLGSTHRVSGDPNPPGDPRVPAAGPGDGLQRFRGAGFSGRVGRPPLWCPPTSRRWPRRGPRWPRRGPADGVPRPRRRAGATASATTSRSTSASSRPAAATTAKATSGPSTPPTWRTSPRATTTAGGRGGASAGERGRPGRGVPGGGWRLTRVTLCFPSQGERRLLPPLRPVRPRLLLPLLPPGAPRAPPGPARGPPPLPPRAAALGLGTGPRCPRPPAPPAPAPLPVAPPCWGTGMG